MITVSISAFSLPFQKLSRGHRDDYDVLGGKRGADPELGGRHQVTSRPMCACPLIRCLLPRRVTALLTRAATPAPSWGGNDAICVVTRAAGAKLPLPFDLCPPRRAGSSQPPGWEVTPGPGRMRRRPGSGGCFTELAASDAIKQAPAKQSSSQNNSLCCTAFKGKGRESLLHQQVTAVGGEQRRTKFYQLLK